MRAFVELWDEITRDRYGVADEKARRFRYGVQVNSLGLTEQQPENNVYRILIEMLAVVLSKKARARAVQLPAWNEALGLPRPWDQQWSLRMQQIMAFETDLLEYDGPLRRQPRGRGQGRGAEGRRPGRARPHRRDGRRGRGDRLHEVRAGGRQHRAARPDRGRRDRGGRGQQVHPCRAEPADRGRRRHPGGGPGRRGGPDRAAAGLARGARPGRGRGGAGGAAAPPRARGRT